MRKHYTQKEKKSIGLQAQIIQKLWFDDTYRVESIGGDCIFLNYKSITLPLVVL